MVSGGSCRAASVPCGRCSSLETVPRGPARAASQEPPRPSPRGAGSQSPRLTVLWPFVQHSLSVPRQHWAAAKSTAFKLQPLRGLGSCHCPRVAVHTLAPLRFNVLGVQTSQGGREDDTRECKEGGSIAPGTEGAHQWESLLSHRLLPWKPFMLTADGLMRTASIPR